MKNDSKKVKSLSKKQLIEQGMNVVAGWTWATSTVSFA